jgi:integrase
MVVVDGKNMIEVTVYDSKHRQVGVIEEKTINIFSHQRYMKAWIAWKEENLHIKSWQPRYKRDQVAYLKKYFAQFDEVSAENLETWLRAVPASQVTKRRHMHSCVSSIARYLYEQEKLITPEEYARIKMLYPKKPPGYEPKQVILFDEDLSTIKQNIDKYYEDREYMKLLVDTLITFLSETGVRVSELADIREEHLHFGELHQKPFVKVKGKYGKTRKVPFSKKAQSAIKQYLVLRPSGINLDALFYVQNEKNKIWTGLKANWVTHEFQRFSAAIKIPFTPHSFRHYKVTKWANTPQIPINTVRLWAGHSSVTVTEKYIHTGDDDALAAAIG